MVIRLALLAALVVDSLVMLRFAFNLDGLWAILLISTGILIGMATIRGNARNAGLLCAVGLVFVPVAVAVRALPAHSFDWSAIDRLDRIEIGGRPEGASIVITDPKTLREFEKLVGTGYYETSHKCGDCSTITLCDRDNRSNYVLLHDSFGRSGGGFIQTVFVPRERAVFRRWFEEILKAHGQKPL